MTKLEAIIQTLAAAVKPGITTRSLDDMAVTLLTEQKLTAAFKDYRPSNFGKEEGYPASICVSIDNEVIHGIPGDRKIEEGQVVKIDVGTRESVVGPDGSLLNYFDDGATTVLVGRCSAVARRLVKATKEALDAGIAQAIAGNTTYDIARAIEAVAKEYEFHVVHGYGGHGIGTELHMEPHVPNEDDGAPGVTLLPGQRLAIEPMFGTNHGFTEVAKDGWAVKLQRGGLASHFEKTITVE